MNAFVAILRALADETRFRIINLLLTHDLCVGALANRLGISKAAVSQHLQVLRKAGLVRGEKRGYWTHYIVERNVLKQVAGGLTEMANHTLSPEGACLKTLPMAATIIKERGEIDMCVDCCQQPDKLKGKPEECTTEQIKECHGDTDAHPCETEKK
jgi:DNA-binding transcriptional ArsR family regulator